MPSGDFLTAILAQNTDAPPYEDIINFPRAKDRTDIQCVMCGKQPGEAGCVIPKQNKDVCRVRATPPHK